jgi:FG-GAP-like repeat
MALLVSASIQACCFSPVSQGHDGGTPPPTYCTLGSALVRNGVSNPADRSLCCNTSLDPHSWSPRLVLTSTFPVEVQASDLASGDFDGDGWPDLAVVSASVDGGTTSILVTIFLNHDGHLFRANDFLLGLGLPGAIAAADFNGDGLADLATGGEHAPLSVMLSKGDGTFYPATNYSAGTVGPGGIKAGHLDGESPSSLICGSDTGLSVLAGIGDGGFLPPVTIGSSRQGALVLGDFNKDGLPDIAEANFKESSGVTVVLGTPGGGFRLGGAYPLPYDLGFNVVWDIATGDFNGDGIPDLVVTGALASFGGFGGVGILYGKGDGTFGNWTPVAVTGNAYGLVVADLDGDGSNEILFTATGTSDQPYYSLYQLASSGMGPMLGADAGTPMLSPDGGLKWLLVADFNRDGALDLAALNGWLNDPSPSTNVSIYMNGCPPDR